MKIYLNFKQIPISHNYKLIFLNYSTNIVNTDIKII